MSQRVFYVQDTHPMHSGVGMKCGNILSVYVLLILLFHLFLLGKTSCASSVLVRKARAHFVPIYVWHQSVAVQRGRATLCKGEHIPQFSKFPPSGINKEKWIGSNEYKSSDSIQKKTRNQAKQSFPLITFLVHYSMVRFVVEHKIGTFLS